MIDVTDQQSEPALEPSTSTLPRIILVLNEKVDLGRLLNATAHLALGFGASADEAVRKELKLQDYVDASGQSHANVSALSLVVLKANSNQLRALRARVVQAGLHSVDFLETMTGGTYLEQLERTRATEPAELDYLGVLIFGTRDQTGPLTRKFSLFRG